MKNDIAPHTAKLIFAGERFVSLPKVADILGNAIDPHNPLIMEDVTLTTLLLSGDALQLHLDLAFEGDETALYLSVTQTCEDPARQLASLTFALTDRLPVHCVVWPGSDVRIPRDQFVAGLSDMFNRAAPAPDGEVTLDSIAPKRIQRPVEPTITVRPAANTDAPASTEARINRYAASMSGVRGTDRRYDAHIQAYESHLRDDLRIGMAAESTDPSQPIEVRLTAWAMSLSAAAISLPVAAPIMAYNLIKGEDLRAAALSVGVAGFVFAIDQSGAMALAF